MVKRLYKSAMILIKSAMILISWRVAMAAIVAIVCVADERVAGKTQAPTPNAMPTESRLSACGSQGVRFTALETANLPCLIQLRQSISRLVVARAVKADANAAGIRLRVHLRNVPFLDGHIIAAEERLELLSVRNAVVSVKDKELVTIGVPYAQTIEVLDSMSESVLDFALSEDVSTAVIALSYEGRVEHHVVRLQNVSHRRLRMGAAQVSLESNLGAPAVYDIRVDRLTPQVRGVRLDVQGLPKDVRWDLHLSAREGGALTQYAFQEGELTRAMVLRVHLPGVTTTGSDVVRVDVPLEFRLVASAIEIGEGGEADSSRPDKEDAAVALWLVPRGVPKLEMKLDNYYAEVRPGGSVALSPLVANLGSREIRDVSVSVEAPIGWKGTGPPNMATLAPGSPAQPALVTLQIGEEVPPGDYQVRLQAQGQGPAGLINAEVKQVRVRVVSPPNRFFGFGLFGLLIASAGAVTFLSVRLARH